MNQAVTLATSSRWAAFNPVIRLYLLLTIGFSMIVSIIGIPVAVIWFLGVGQWWARHYYKKLECELTPRTLRFRKGILFQIEKTIPLENIQDVTFIEGPLLRFFNLSRLKFETAGQSHDAAATMQLTGIVDAQQFRDEILLARQRLRQLSLSEPVRTEGAGSADQLAVLQRIEQRLDEIADLMRKH